MTPEQIRALYDFNSWANHRVLGVCGSLTNEQFTRDLGSSFPSVRDTLAHILGGEWIWLERWQGRSPAALPEAAQFPHLAGIRARWAEVERGLLQFVARVSPEDLECVMEYRNIRGNRFAYPLRSMLQHLVNHGTYHRGQVTTMLRQLGARPRPTDFLRYFDALAGLPED